MKSSFMHSLARMIRANGYCSTCALKNMCHKTSGSDGLIYEACYDIDECADILTIKAYLDRKGETENRGETNARSYT